MIFLKILLVFYIIIGFFWWLIQLLLSLRIITKVPLLEKLPKKNLENLPKVSVIIPACNEADTIEEAIQTRLHDDYPNLEIILIDDRSTDGTSEIIERIAAKDNRVKSIHIAELPFGWLGKQYAMNQGVKLATGDWFLFSDADVKIKPGTLKLVIGYCESKKIDHLAIFPEIPPTNFLLDTLLSVFIRFLCIGGRIWAVEDEKSNAAVGSGSFNLVRRSAFEKTKGFEWLRLETVDDVGLGKMLKESGARSSIINGRKYLSVYLYRSLKGMAIGSERPVFAGIGNFSLTRLILTALIYFGFELSPFFALIPIGIPFISFLGLIMVVMALATSISISRWMNRPLLPSIFYPIGTTIMVIIMIRAGILGAKRGGIFWRGTFYPTEILKEGKRYSL
jgi:glycosyltransferase involved in cell wall biosynthesis